MASLINSESTVAETKSLSFPYRKIFSALLIIFTLAVVIATGRVAYEITLNSKTNQAYKVDAAELNHFKYGLFSVDAWKAQLTVIITDEIENFHMTKGNRKALRSQLERQLEVLIDGIMARIEKSESKFKLTLMDSFIDIKDIKKGIPEYATAILAEMSSPRSEAELKGILKQKIGGYLKTTFDKQPDNQRDRVIAKYGTTEESARQNLEKLISRKNKVIEEQALILIILASVVFLIEFFKRRPLTAMEYFSLLAVLAILLAVGVTTPMIDMEAKISKMEFVLFDHPIKFENQVLYFQSKSIINVFNLMIHHKEVKMQFVGILMVLFSIVFPVFKMASSVAYYFDMFRARTSKVVSFFVIQSGKWSMADVMVVAIFMAFIGFNGIINSEMGLLQQSSENVDLMTTNGTSLLPGYYVFLTYTILAMFLAGFLKSRPRLPKAA
jgi:hypothetical protein